jgi:ABC-type transport system involved in multi-copper enzyme maturation permease subunit
MTGLLRQVHAEWTKFRTVRGWIIGMLLVVVTIVGVGLLGHSECGTQINNQTTVGCPGPSVGPGGVPVDDDYYFVHQPLDGDGTITVRVTSLTGQYDPNGGVSASNQDAGLENGDLQPWSKAGIMIEASTAQGSAYAAMMVTGSNGVRMQWNYTGDTPGLPGKVSASSPRWLRLVRSGDSVTGYDSLDGVHWFTVGTAVLSGLPSAAQGGMFATSPQYSQTTSSGIGSGSGYGVSTQATATMDSIRLSWPDAGWKGGAFNGKYRGEATMASNGYHEAGGAFTVSGSGDIAPVTIGGNDPGQTVQDALHGTFAGLIAVIVVAAMFITAEYRRGLIRLTLSARPRRGQVLAAKAVVLAAVSFVAGLIGVAIVIPLGLSNLRSGGVPIIGVPMLTQVRIVAGTAAMLAVAAVLALAIGTAIRRSAVSIAAVITAIFIPYLLATVPGLLTSGMQQWLMRVSPAAALSIQQALPSYHQVTAAYTSVNDYYPLSPLAGFTVLCAWTVAALVLATHLLNRRDA